jgi:DegV family protein with EDD domain
MGRTAVVTDSSACLPAELAAGHGIITVPLGLIIDGEVYPDAGLTSAELFERIDASKSGAQTTSPAPGEFLAAFERARDEGADAVACLTLSAKYSGTYSAAVNAGKLADEHIPGLEVRVADTGGLAMTHGFAVLAAARAVEMGADIEKVVATAEMVGRSAQLVGALDTLRYLVKGGRLPWVVGWAASLLRIKPVLAFADGRARSVGRTRTWAGAKRKLLAYAATRESGRPLHASVMHTDAPERAEELAREVCERFRPAEMFVTEFTNVMAVHTGPGFVGLGFYEDD